MSTELSVNILSPAKVVSRGKARLVQAPGSLGQLGVLPGHAPMVAELTFGELTVEQPSGTKEEYFITGGYLDVAKDEVTVLVDIIEKITDIDVGRAERAKQRAMQRLEQREAGHDMARAQAAFARASTRIALAGRMRG